MKSKTNQRMTCNAAMRDALISVDVLLEQGLSWGRYGYLNVERMDFFTKLEEAQNALASAILKAEVSE